MKTQLFLFLIGPLTGDHGSFDTYNSPDIQHFFSEVEIIEIQACGFCSELSSLSNGSSKQARRTFYDVIGQNGKNMWDRMIICKFFIKKRVSTSLLRFYCDVCNM